MRLAHSPRHCAGASRRIERNLCACDQPRALRRSASAVPVTHDTRPVSTAALPTGLDAAVAAGAAAARPAGSWRRPRRLSLSRNLEPDTHVNWHRWELMLFRRAEEMEEAEEGEEWEAGEFEEEAEEGAAGARDDGAQLAAAYFRRWDDPTAHLPLLQDRALVAAWSQALASAPPGALAGKTVLDVGCGTGLLSLLAAKAGAARVIAVDGSAGAVDAARRVVRANGLQDTITVVHGAIEDVELPSVSPGQVDVIVSNWMGPGLLGGGMLRSVAYAADVWLRPGGLVLPDSVSLWAVGLEDREALQEAKKTWSSLAGLDMSAALAQVIQHARLDAPRRAAQLLTAPQQVAAWRPAGLRSGEQLLQGGAYVRCPLRLPVEREERLFGLLLYWEAAWDFGGALGAADGAKPAVRLSTGPLSAPTHHKQLVVNLPRSMLVSPGEVLVGELELRPGGADPRDVEVALRLAKEGSADAPVTASCRVSAQLGR